MSVFRANIEAMGGYTPGEQPQTAGFIKLNTNENPYPPSPRVLEAIRAAASERLRLYPDPLATRFRETAAKLLGIEPDWILACNGSDDALTILTRACVESGSTLVSPTPSYPLYRVLAQIQGARFDLRPYTMDWKLPPGLVDSASLVLVANPNSPTGTMVQPEDLLAEAQKARCLVVADEAYADFAPTNCVGMVARCERLVVTRSLSKSHGLAGIRFGYIVAQPDIIRGLIKVKDSYNCDAISIAAASAALADEAYFQETRAKVRATRARLARGMENLGFDVTPSNANFVWAQRKQPVEPIYRALKERRILIRYLTYAGYGEGLRVSVGTDAEIETFLLSLSDLV